MDRTASQRKIRILLVDDEPLLLRCLARQLGQHQVFTASCAAEALATVAYQELDLVLSDHCMPGGDGVSLLEQIRRSHPGVRRAMMSADPPQSLAQLLGAGLVEHFLPKPFDGDAIAELIQAVASAQPEAPDEQPEVARFAPRKDQPMVHHDQA